jgi:hypothetical protein
MTHLNDHTLGHDQKNSDNQTENSQRDNGGQTGNCQGTNDGGAQGEDAMSRAFVFGSKSQVHATISGFDSDETIVTSSYAVGSSDNQANNTSVSLLKFKDSAGDTVGVSEVVGETNTKFILTVHEGGVVQKLVLSMPNGEHDDVIKFEVADGGVDDVVTIANGKVTVAKGTVADNSSGSGCHEGCGGSSQGSGLGSHQETHTSDPLHHGEIFA